MANTIKFRGASVVSMDVRLAPKGESSFTKINFRADFSEPVREAMGWDERPENYGGASLIGELVGVEMYLKPSKRELDKFAFKLAIRKVHNFQLIVLNKKGKDGAPDTEEVLSFTVETNTPRAFKTIGDWIEALGKEKAQLTVSYTEQAEMESGDDVEATDEQRQAVLTEE